MPEVSGALRLEVRMRAWERCEYCLYPTIYGLSPFEVDHILAAKHGGAFLTCVRTIAPLCIAAKQFTRVRSLHL